MNRFNKAAVVAAAATMVSMAAQATQTPFELGFTESGKSDYIIDIGTTSILGQSTVVNLSPDFSASTFSSTFGSANGVSMSVVSGNSTFGQYDVYATQLRVGGAGSSAAVAGSDLTSQGHSSTQISTGAAVLTGNLAWPTTTGAGVVDSTLSYSTKVVASMSPSSFVGKTGVEPAAAIDGSGIIYEDLWFATAAQAYTYQGYFTFNANTDNLTFTSANVASAAVPEPATYGVLAGLGLFVVALRRQLSRKAA